MNESEFLEYYKTVDYTWMVCQGDLVDVSSSSDWSFIADWNPYAYFLTVETDCSVFGGEW